MSKHENICLPVNKSTQQATLSHETGIFSWANVARMLNAIPMEICECKTEADAKGYVKALAVILSAFILAAIEEGGAL